jgi:hypothetical protein
MQTTAAQMKSMICKISREVYMCALLHANDHRDNTAASSAQNMGLLHSRKSSAARQSSLVLKARLHAVGHGRCAVAMMEHKHDAATHSMAPARQVPLHILHAPQWPASRVV